LCNLRSQKNTHRQIKFNIKVHATQGLKILLLPGKRDIESELTSTHACDLLHHLTQISAAARLASHNQNQAPVPLLTSRSS